MQTDIFGGMHRVEGEQLPKKQERSTQTKPFRPITIHDGHDETHATNSAMLIHRSLQKKLSATGLTTSAQNAAFVRIFMNELKIKSGTMDPVTAVRDSLISFFCS
jgi:hypothetical protein